MKSTTKKVILGIATFFFVLGMVGFLVVYGFITNFQKKMSDRIVSGAGIAGMEGGVEYRCAKHAVNIYRSEQKWKTDRGYRYVFGLKDEQFRQKARHYLDSRPDKNLTGIVQEHLPDFIPACHYVYSPALLECAAIRDTDKSRECLAPYKQKFHEGVLFFMESELRKSDHKIIDFGNFNVTSIRAAALEKRIGGKPSGIMADQYDLRVSVDKKEYKVGSPIKISYNMTNCTENLGMALYLLEQGYKSRITLVPQTIALCDGRERPRGTVSGTLIWDGVTKADYQNGQLTMVDANVEPGTYTIRATLYHERQGTTVGPGSSGSGAMVLPIYYVDTPLIQIVKE